MGRLARGLPKPLVSLIVGVVVGIAVLGGLIDLMISSGSDSTESVPPTGEACEKLLEQQGLT